MLVLMLISCCVKSCLIGNTSLTKSITLIPCSHQDGTSVQCETARHDGMTIETKSGYFHIWGLILVISIGSDSSM